MGLFKEIKKNVKTLDETIDHTDQEIDHFGRVLDTTEDSVAAFKHCISHAEVAIQSINQMTNHSEDLISRLHSLVNIVENREMVIMTFYGATTIFFLLSILIIENLISSLIANTQSNQSRFFSFLGNLFDFLFLSSICFALRLMQFILFIIVTYSCLEGIKKTIITKQSLVETDFNVVNQNNHNNIHSTNSVSWSNSSIEGSSRAVPLHHTLTTNNSSTPWSQSTPADVSDTIPDVNSPGLSTPVNHVSTSSSRCSRSDLITSPENSFSKTSLEVNNYQTTPHNAL